MDFGFAGSYTEYRVDTLVGGTGTLPLVTFQPLFPDTTVQLEGPQDVEFAPPGFPDDFNNGLFVGMHGQFFLAGVSNEENPLAYVDLRATTYLAWVDQAETGVGHLDGLLSTQTKLYVADISPDGGFNSSSSDEGIIYRIVTAVATLPAPRFLTSAATMTGGVAPALDWDDVPGERPTSSSLPTTPVSTVPTASRGSAAAPTPSPVCWQMTLGTGG